MNRQPYQTPPRWWSPKLRPWWVRLMRPLRRGLLRRRQRLVRIDVQGLEHLRAVVEQGCGVLLTPNHSTHYDTYALYEAADRVGRHFHVLTAWQVFAMGTWFDRWNMRSHGCFSIDRESNDLKAFRQAVEILQRSPHPLVVYPEGDIYHTNDRVMPFRDGAAAIALSAAKRAARPVVCVPCAIKFRYVDDPTPELLRLTDKLERRMTWTPRPDLSLARRLVRLTEGMVALKELEHLGAARAGPLPERIGTLCAEILGRVENRLGVRTQGDIPERVKELRHHLIRRSESAEANGGRDQHLADMEDLFLVIQLYSYPADYLGERPTVERLAETLDKFEEDILQASLPSVRGRRRVTIRFGEPIPVVREPGRRDQVAELTERLRQCVQRLLDEINEGC